MADYLPLCPPILVLVLGYLTRKIIFSLAIGAWVAAFIASNFSIVDSLLLTGKQIWDNLQWENGNLLICLFLFFLGILVSALQHSGGVYASGHFIQKHLKNKRSTETASLFLSTLLFIDDYFSSLTVGSVMHPIAERAKIPSVKLAFLVDSMSAPLAILCPFSGWVAAIIGFLRDNQITDDPNASPIILASPLSTYFHILPFMFYSFILVAAIWFIVRRKISFGKMKQYEQSINNTAHLTQEKTYDFEKHPKQTALIDFFIPLSLLLICIIVAMLWSGNWTMLGGSRALLSAFQHAQAPKALFAGGGFALIFCCTYFIARQKIHLNKMPAIYWEGIILMLPAIAVLVLAWTLGDILRNELHIGEYLANMLIAKIDLIYLPPLFFLVAFLAAFMIGSSWGSAAMIFPIAIPLVVSMQNLIDLQPTLEQVPILLPVLGAVLSGCVAGDHISPISDTTIMSATSTRCPIMDHVKTQIPYTLPIIFSTFLSFVLASFLQPYGFWVASLISTSFGIGLSLFSLWGLHLIALKQ